jgi:hypothetical protein
MVRNEFYNRLHDFIEFLHKKVRWDFIGITAGSLECQGIVLSSISIHLLFKFREI